MGTDAPTILVVDSSVLINFLRVDRADLLHKHPARMLVTEHAREEVTEAYLDQKVRLDIALSDGTLELVRIEAVEELSLMLSNRSPQGKKGKQFGLGECSAIAAAVSRGYDLAMEDTAATKHVKKHHPRTNIHTTSDILVTVIKAGHLTIPEADAIKKTWAETHRFVVKASSFSELISYPHPDNSAQTRIMK